MAATMKREDLEWCIAVTTAAQVEDGKMLMQLITEEATPTKVLCLAGLASVAVGAVANFMGKDPMEFMAEGALEIAQMPEETTL